MNGEASNMTLLTFFKTTWHAEASGHLDYFEQYGGNLWFYCVYFCICIYAYSNGSYTVFLSLPHHNIVLDLNHLKCDGKGCQVLSGSVALTKMKIICQSPITF